MTPTTSLSILLELPAGTFIGPYRLEELLSSSTFGIAYRATRDGRNFMLKLPLANIVKPLLEERSVIEAGITREVLALMSLQHPGVTPVEGFGRWPDPTSDLLYVAMELPRGMPLTTWCQASAGSLAEIVEVFRLLALSLHELHSKGLVHRDLKSTSVFVVPGDDGVQWQPVLVDFGIGRPFNIPGPTAEQLRLNATGRWAPELFTTGAYEDANYTPATDLFALGHLFYEALTGRAPIHCDDNGVMCATGKRVLGPSVLVSQMPPEFDAPALRLLATRPEDRTPSALAFAEELGRIQNRFAARRTLLAVANHPRFQQRSPETDAALKRLLVVFGATEAVDGAKPPTSPVPASPPTGAQAERPTASLYILGADEPTPTCAVLADDVPPPLPARQSGPPPRKRSLGSRLLSWAVDAVVVAALTSILFLMFAVVAAHADSRPPATHSDEAATGNASPAVDGGTAPGVAPSERGAPLSPVPTTDPSATSEP